MLTFLLFAVALMQLSNQQTVEQLIEGYYKLIAPVKDDCLKESGADWEIIDKEVKFGEFSEDINTKCFWKCYLKKYDIINDKDEIIEENSRKFIVVPDKKVADKIFEKCAHIRGSDLCDTSDKICKCVYLEEKAAVSK